jgi:thioredoxin reductase (NADPH)
MHFAPHARQVSMVIRGDSLRSTLSQYLLDRIEAAPNIEVLARTEVTALHGDGMLREITLRDKARRRERRQATRWLFVCIGGDPQTQWAEGIGMVRDEAGYIVTGPDLRRGGARLPDWPLDRDPYYLETSIPGVFAAGDVRHDAVRRCAAAVGEGAMAVAFVHRVLDGS